MPKEEQAALAPEARRRTIRELGVYFALTFAITWGLGAALIFARPQLEAVVGPLGRIDRSWLYYLAVAAPTIAAVTCSLAFAGLGGLKALGARFLRPVKLLWIATAILVWPAGVAALGLAAKLLGRGDAIDLHALAVGAPVMAVTTWALVVDPGGLCEETGWRGYALPRLVSLVPPAWAALGLGLVWGLWHLPAFFVSDLTQSHFGLGIFLLASTGLSVVMTWLFVHANGNVVVAGIIPHLMTNLLLDANVFRRDPLQYEDVVVGVLALGLIVGLGPTLAGWRKRRAMVARTA